MQIALSEEASRFVERLVASGEFDSPGEAVAEALRLLRRDRELDAAIARGISDFEQGRYRDGEEAFADLKLLATERVARETR